MQSFVIDWRNMSIWFSYATRIYNIGVRKSLAQHSSNAFHSLSYFAVGGKHKNYICFLFHFTMTIVSIALMLSFMCEGRNFIVVFRGRMFFLLPEIWRSIPVFFMKKQTGWEVNKQGENINVSSLNLHKHRFSLWNVSSDWFTCTGSRL